MGKDEKRLNAEKRQDRNGNPRLNGRAGFFFRRRKRLQYIAWTEDDLQQMLTAPNLPPTIEFSRL